MVLACALCSGYVFLVKIDNNDGKRERSSLVNRTHISHS